MHRSTMQVYFYFCVYYYYLCQEVLRSVVYVGWFVGVFVNSHPATVRNGRWVADGSVTGGRGVARTWHLVAPYESLF